jgi:hypothetical protein
MFSHNMRNFLPPSSANFLEARGAQIPGARATKFCTVAPNICGPSMWNLLYVTLMAPRILEWLLDFWKSFAPLH